MRIFNLVNKAQYIVALVLLLAFVVFILPHYVSETFVNPLNPDFPNKSPLLSDYNNIYFALIDWTTMESFLRYGSVIDLKQQYSDIWYIKILHTAKFILEKYLNIVYATVEDPYCTEACKLSAQLIVIYIFTIDGKKRLLTLSYN